MSEVSDKVEKLRKETLARKETLTRKGTIQKHKSGFHSRKPTHAQDILSHLSTDSALDSAISEEELDEIRQRVALLEKENAKTMEELDAATALVMSLPTVTEETSTNLTGKEKSE